MLTTGSAYQDPFITTGSPILIRSANYVPTSLKMVICGVCFTFYIQASLNIFDHLNVFTVFTGFLFVLHSRCLCLTHNILIFGSILFPGGILLGSHITRSLLNNAESPLLCQSPSTSRRVGGGDGKVEDIIKTVTGEFFLLAGTLSRDRQERLFMKDDFK